jgi:hypothetical protein
MRGRAWIVLIGVLLFGLVAINVSLLKVSAEAGRNAEKVKALRIQNTQLNARVSRLASAERLERAGRDLGLAMSIAGRVRYLSVRPSDGRKAARAIRTWETLPGFAFAPLPLPPAPAVVAETETPAPVGATGAAGPTGVTGVAGTTPTTGVTPETATPEPGTATTPVPANQTPATQAPATTSPTGGQYPTEPTG